MNLTQTARQLSVQLAGIDFDSLPISTYNKEYIRRLRPALSYYLNIYARCLTEGMKMAGVSDIRALRLVDFGGGCGFLSLLAARAGARQVIYVDLNPQSVETVQVLKQTLGFGPDVVLSGSSDVLAAWSRREEKPQLLVATDMIEHVYDLPRLFRELAEVNDGLAMLFTTASTPFNPWVKRRLHRWMDDSERGTMEQPNYRTLRLEYLRKQCPRASEEELERWADLTRGLVYEDIRKALETGIFPPLPGRHNTCDPRTGNWMERILSLAAYKQLAAGIGYSLEVEKGFYNEERESRAAAWVCRLLNGLIRATGRLGLCLAPFIVLLFRKNRG